MILVIFKPRLGVRLLFVAPNISFIPSNIFAVSTRIYSCFFSRNIVGYVENLEVKEHFSRGVLGLRMRDRYANNVVGGIA